MSISSILKDLFIDKTFKEKIGFLKKVPIFSDLNNKALGEVLSIAYQKKYAKDETIFTEGNVGTALYIIKSGEIAITKKNKVFSRLHSGNFFGEMALLEEIPRSATAKASQESELLLIYKIKFDGLLERNTVTGMKIIRNLARILSTRLRQMGEDYTKST